jgi:hypothetical protein
MKENKLHIEEIKFFVPDYITGSLNENEMLLVKEAIDKYPEVSQFYNEMKSIFEFAEKVELEEPSPQYFNNLLPRIHQKIEVREEKKAAKSTAALIWKILVPVAAIIILFLVYMIAFNPGENVNEKNKTIVKTNSVKKDIEPKQKTTDVIEKKNEESVVDNTDTNKKHKRTVISKMSVKENIKPEDVKDKTVEKLQILPAESDDFAEVMNDEPVILGAGERGTLEGDIENAIDELNQNEKDVLLAKLEKSNL